MLPLVGSTMVPPGPSFPSRSAASIMICAMRSFTEPPGIQVLELGVDGAGDALGDLREPDQRRVAHEFRERIDDCGHLGMHLRSVAIGPWARGQVRA